VFCEIGSLAAGEAVTVSVQTRPTIAGVLEATAEASLDQRDPTVDDNRALLRVRVLTAARAPAVAVEPLRLTRSGPGLVVFRRSKGEIRTSFMLNRAAKVSVTVLDSSGRPLSLLAGSRLGRFGSGRPSGTLTRSLSGGRNNAVIRLSSRALGKALKVRLVARDAAGRRTTLVLRVR